MGGWGGGWRGRMVYCGWVGGVVEWCGWLGGVAWVVSGFVAW